MPIDIIKDDLETAMKKLKAREESFKRLESISQLGSWEVDLKTNKSIWSDQSYKIYGLDKQSTQPSLELFLSKLLPKYIPIAQKELAKAMQSGKTTTFQAQITRADGKIIDILINGQVIFDENNLPSKLIGSTQDITRQIDTQRELKEFSELIESSTNEIYIIDFDTFEYLYVNNGASKELGYTKEELLNMSIFDINPNLTLEEAKKIKDLGLKHGKVLNRTIHKRKNGTIYHVQSLLHGIKYKNQDAIVIFDIDITQQIENELLLKKQTQRLNYQATHDSLTNLPNRMLFKDRLSQIIATSKRNSTQFALLFIDLDQFKKINDSLGHHIGDDVLIEAAKRFKATLRDEDTLARLGGDEFTIILKNIKNVESVSVVAKKIIDVIKKPIISNGHRLFISSSIGISIFPQDATIKDDLIKYADAAMYKAKDEGRDNFQFYSKEMTDIAFERVTMESDLRIAIKEKQFVVYFQPQYNASTDAIIGMEALVRWQHPEYGLVPPFKFIPLAEDNGMIIEIDRIVMKEAMKQFSKWYQQGYNPGVLALNLAMKQLNKDDFMEFLETTMKEISFKAKWLELEVTEGQVMQNPTLSIKKLTQINNLGIEIAIDDFGTGYSSLAYLKKLPLDKLKIDQSFIRDIPEDEDDKAITKAIIALAKSLNLKLIAEGVEDTTQKEFLLENGCENIQGYLYSKPIPAKDVEKLLVVG